MGSLRSTPSARCRYAACFALGFVVASLLLAAMFWIVWCYLGLTVVQVSDAQRRAPVVYSLTTSKPLTTTSPSNRTEVDGALESSLNAISKSPVTPPSQPRRRSGDSSSELPKGDFAARPPGGASQNSTRRDSITPSVTSSSDERRASILNEGDEGVLHPRKISTSNSENRAQDQGLSDIKPTQTYAPAQSDPLPLVPRDERRPVSRDSDKRDDIQGSRPSYRDPDFERETPPRRSEPERRRYDDDYDDRRSPSRYDKRDRGRDTDDRYSKGDTRVYPDDRPRQDDRYSPRDSVRRRGDDRDREDRYRDDRYRDYDDRYRDRDDRHRYKDDSRDEERYRKERPYIDDDRDRRRDDRLDSDDKYRSRDDRYRHDDRYRPREDRYRDDDDRYRDRTYDDKRDRYIPRDDDDRYTRTRERDYKDPILSSRVDHQSDRKTKTPQDERRPSDYDIPLQDRPRTSLIEESRTDDRYLDREDEYPRPSKYDDRDRIAATRTKDVTYISRSADPISRSRDDTYKSGSSVIDGRKREDDRYPSNRDRPKYYDDEDTRRGDDSRIISPSSVRETDSSRREVSRDPYRTRTPDDRKVDDVGLERRSYSAEEEEYRRQNSRTRYYDDKDRKSSENSRKDYRDDKEYPRRTRPDDDDDHRSRISRPRGDYDTDRSRVPGRYDDDDRPPKRHLPEYDEPRRRSDAGLRKDSYPRDVVEDGRTSLPRSEERRPATDRRYDDDIPPRRPISDDRPFRSRPDTIDDRPLRPAIERSSEDGRPYRDDAYPADDRRSDPDGSSRYIPPRSDKREIFVGSPTTPRDVVVREKRYPPPGRHIDDYDKEEDRILNAKDVIEAALKHSDAQNQNPRKVSYPVYSPNTSNLTATDYIPVIDRRGTNIMSRRRRRSRTY